MKTAAEDFNRAAAVEEENGIPFLREGYPVLYMPESETAGGRKLIILLLEKNIYFVYNKN